MEWTASICGLILMLPMAVTPSLASPQVGFNDFSRASNKPIESLQTQLALSSSARGVCLTTVRVEAQQARDGKTGSIEEEEKEGAQLQPGTQALGGAGRGGAGTQLPDAPSEYFPLSRHDKFHLFLKRAYSPYTLSSAVFEATWAQMTGQWYYYGGGMQGWGKRLGATLADTEARSFIQTFLLSSLLHQDPRYFPSRKRGLIPRAWYAGTRVIVTKNDDGGETFNTSEVLGTLFTSSLQNAYYPRHDRGFGNTMNRFVGAFGSDATSNLLREFSPDLKRLFRKHAPEKVKEMEESLPSWW